MGPQTVRAADPRSKYRSVVSTTIGSRVADSLTRITLRRPYSIEAAGCAGEDVSTLFGGQILQAGEHQFLERAEIAGHALDGEVAPNHATLWAWSVPRSRLVRSGTRSVAGSNARASAHDIRGMVYGCEVGA
jgi:hypothetical protein